MWLRLLLVACLFALGCGPPPIKRPATLPAVSPVVANPTLTDTPAPARFRVGDAVMLKINKKEVIISGVNENTGYGQTYSVFHIDQAGHFSRSVDYVWEYEIQGLVHADK